MEGKAVFFSLCLRLLVYLSHHHWRSVFCSWFLRGFLGQKATGWATGKATGVIFFVQQRWAFSEFHLFGDQSVEGGKMIQRVILAWYLFDTLCFFDVTTQHVPKNLPLALPVSLYVYIPVPFFAGYVHSYICILNNKGSSSLTCFNIASSNHQLT